MIKNLSIAVGGLVVIVLVLGFWSQFRTTNIGGGPYQACTMEAKICPDGTAVGRSGPNCEFAACPDIQAGTDYKNATYILGGESVTLVDGSASVAAAPGSASKITTQIFGAPTEGDIDGDGTKDAAFLLVQSTGGSGTFYYLAVALSTNGGVRGTNGLLLGDRIAPQTVEVRNGVIIANYADRNVGEPMTARPSLGVSKYARVINGVLTEIAQPAAGQGVVTGTVTLSPTCPVERIPPDPQCAPKGYATDVTASQAGTVVGKTTSAADGIFSLSLPPGTYTLTAKGGAQLPRCESQSVTISKGGTQTVTISCDTGIR